MKRRAFSVLFLLVLAAILGGWLGTLARPENHQLRGKLAFDAAQILFADKGEEKLQKIEECSISTTVCSSSFEPANKSERSVNKNRIH